MDFKNQKNSFKNLGYMVDCSRGAALKISTLKQLIDILSAFGYTYLMLYLEDMYEIEGEPYFGYMRGRYSCEELKDLDAYAISKGIELRPCIQTLAHLGRIKRHMQYSYLFDIDDILNIKDERTYELIDKMFSAINKTFSSKNIHIGMDEAYYLGRGKILDEKGLFSKKELMETHLLKVANLAKKYNFNCQIWADMILRSYNESDDKQNFKIKLPDNIIAVDWRYYIKSNKDSLDELKFYKRVTNGNIYFASGAHKWYGFVPNNIYSMHLIKEEMNNCIKTGIEDFLITGWADGAADASIFATLPSLFYASCLAHNISINDAKDYFKDVIGINFDDYLMIDNLNRLNMKKSDKRINNLSFIYFYNDLFQGMFDDAILPNAATLIKKNISKFHKLANTNFKYNYIFKSMFYMAKFLTYKVELSKSIYNHYQLNNKNELANDIKDLKKAILYLKQFIKAYEIQWHNENKSFGYEKQCIRLGGLLTRLKYCESQLNKYLNNEISQIDELEEKHLTISLYAFDKDNISNFVYNFYEDIVSGGSMKNI